MPTDPQARSSEQSYKSLPARILRKLNFHPQPSYPRNDAVPAGPSLSHPLTRAFHMFSASWPAAGAPLVSATLLALFTGCGRENITVFRVPKEHPSPELTRPGQSTNAAPPGTLAEKLAYAVPDGWRELPGTDPAIARFAVIDAAGSAQVTIAAFPGEAGGLLANVNRWRAQVNLGPITSAELGGIIEQLETSAGVGALVDLTGSDPENQRPLRLIGVILRCTDRTWFLKIVGDADAVARHKQAFIRFVQSARFNTQ